MGGVRAGGTLAVALLLVIVGSGCDKVTGGGWIASSASPLEKASFGFSAKCENRKVNGTPTAVLYDGQLEYQDEGANIRIHGDIEPDEFAQVPDATCKELDPLLISASAIFEGTYRNQPGGQQGDFVVTVVDNGEPGALSGDAFCIDLTGAIVYANCGLVQGGNIQVH